MLLVGGRSTALKGELRIATSKFCDRNTSVVTKSPLPELTNHHLPNKNCLTRRKKTFSGSRGLSKTLVSRLEDACIPPRGSKLAAGHDLYSITTLTIPAHSRSLDKTALTIAVPNGTYGQIVTRSGLATKGISVDAGVIDADYRGELKVLLVNHGSSDYEVKTGDRIV